MRLLKTVLFVTAASTMTGCSQEQLAANGIVRMNRGQEPTKNQLLAFEAELRKGNPEVVAYPKRLERMAWIEQKVLEGQKVSKADFEFLMEDCKLRDACKGTAAELRELLELLAEAAPLRYKMNNEPELRALRAKIEPLAKKMAIFRM
jgi:hypothetical protein